MPNKKVEQRKAKVIYFESNVAALLEKLAQENAVSFNALVKMACREWLRKDTKQLVLSLESLKEAGTEEPSIRFADDD